MKASTIFTVLAGICLLTSCTNEVKSEDTANIPDEQPISTTAPAAVLTTAAVTASTVRVTSLTTALQITTDLTAVTEIQTSASVQFTDMVTTSEYSSTAITATEESYEPVLVLPDETDAGETEFPLIPLE